MPTIYLNQYLKGRFKALIKSSRVLLKNGFGFASLFWILCATLIFLYIFLPFAQKTLIITGSTMMLVLKTVLIAVTCIGLLAALFAVCYSCEKSFFEKANGAVTTVGSLFYYFRSAEFFSALRFAAGYFLIKLIALLLCAVPVCAVTYMLFSALKSAAQMWVICALFSLVIACAVCSVLTFGKLSRLMFLARYLFFVTKKGNALSLFLMSAKKMEKHTGKLLKLKFSLFPYKLLCLFVLPVGHVIFLHRQCYALLAKEIMQENVEKKADS